MSDDVLGILTTFFEYIQALKGCPSEHPKSTRTSPRTGRTRARDTGGLGARMAAHPFTPDRKKCVFNQNEPTKTPYSARVSTAKLNG